MSLAQAFSGAQHAAVRLLAVAACGLTLAGCDTLSSLNPFGQSKTYKPEIVAEVPAEEMYNDGLARLKSRDFVGAAKKFGDLDKQYPYSDWSRRALIMTAYANYEGREYNDSITALAPLSPAPSRDAGRGLCPVPVGHVLLQPDPGRDPRPGIVRAALGRFRSSWTAIRIAYAADAAEIQVASDQLGGKEMEVGASTSASATTPAPSTASATWWPATSRPAT
jgi:outer membrane protein assembly factor BamD